ncbi:MAG: ribonuclease G [Ignavibacteriae bacterium]|nr:MAG: ribonuclease G [Ignavibacteriota bacterium]
MENTSGQGDSAEVPREILNWNWGAFFLNWVWGIRNKTYIAFYCMVPVIGFVMMIVLGLKGNEWAWQNKRWESIEQFQHEQKIWSKCGIIIAIVVISLGVLGFILNPLLKLLETLQGG